MSRPLAFSSRFLLMLAATGLLSACVQSPAGDANNMARYSYTPASGSATAASLPLLDD